MVDEMIDTYLVVVGLTDCKLQIGQTLNTENTAKNLQSWKHFCDGSIFVWPNLVFRRHSNTLYNRDFRLYAELN